MADVGAGTGHVLGFGGVFLRSPDPEAARGWYARVLGIEFSKWGGAKFPPLPKGSTNLSLFAQSTSHFDPSTREVMLNLVVDDLDAVLARVEAEGVPVLDRQTDETFGRFAWIMDPDGTKLELWEPTS
jgi:predicted enzyme related to lactoylglutathione lyase